MNGAALQRLVTINNPQGVHMRPSAAFVELASTFESAVTLVTNDGRTIDGKSIWSMMTLGVAGLQGCELRLCVEGPDAPVALEALATLLASTPNYDAPTNGVPPGG